MITSKMLEGANKIAFIKQNYPEHKLNDVISLLQMPAIDINTALWAAQELGFVSKPDAETGVFELKTPPEIYDLGKTVRDLQDAIVYSFTELAKKETDLEETYFSQWVQGYDTHDILVAMKELLNDRVMFEYDVNDPELDKKGKPVLNEDTHEPIINVYTFFTLYENGEQRWGEKQFKRNPITGQDKPKTEGV